MRKIFFLTAAGFLLMSIPLHVLSQAEDVLSGKSWIGIVNEKGYGVYPVHMSFQSLERGSFYGTIQYPFLKCGGILRYEGQIYILK